MPLCLVSALSDILPGNSDERKVIAPSGEIPISALNLLLFENATCCSLVRLVALHVCIIVQLHLLLLVL